MEYGVAPQGFRMPEAMRLGTVRLQVADVQRSLEFYAGLLGMHVLASDPTSASLGVQDSTEPLLELRQGGATRPDRRGRLGLYHFAVLLPDRPALGRILNHLVQSGIQPGAADHLVSEALYLQDPDDLGIEIYRDRPRGEWKSHGRQLAMSSDPLDARGILEAGAGGAWTGMPRDTRIGHIHLHVGNLDDARSFYHDALGLDVIVWSYPGALFMSAGGYHHHLGVNTWAGPGAAAPTPDEPRLLSWQIRLPTPADIAAVVDSLQQNGRTVSVEEPGGSIAVDPWETVLRLRTD